MYQANSQLSTWKILENRKWFIAIGTILAFIAGTVNGIATNAIVFERVSHLSGRVNNMFRDLLIQPSRGLLVVVIIYVFILGAYLGGILLRRVGLSNSLLLPIIPLLVACALLYVLGNANTSKDLFPFHRYAVAFLMSLAMGVQNGVTSQTSMGRTTHFTGDLTDLGIALSNHNSRHAWYIFSKHLGFACGGLTGFLATQSLPPYLGIGLCAICLYAVVKVFETINLRECRTEVA